MPTAETSAAFTLRAHGYDPAEVEATIAALESRIAQLEQASSSDAGLLADARYQALRLLMTAREDAEAMVEEARQEAAAIRAEAQAAEPAKVPTLTPELEVIKAPLPVPLQHAFVSVARHRVG